MDEVVNGAVTRTYAYGLQRISENQLIGGVWTPSFYGYDGHGNVRFLTNSAGTITDSYDYDAFGMPITTTGTTPNNFLYSGERFDQNIGLFHLRARDYNPLTGRFETMDPAEGNILNPATLHKYVYAGNNPVNASDPTGRAPLFEQSLIDDAIFPELRQVAFAIIKSPITRGVVHGLALTCYAANAFVVVAKDLGYHPELPPLVDNVCLIPGP